MATIIPPSKVSEDVSFSTASGHFAGKCLLTINRQIHCTFTNEALNDQLSDILKNVNMIIGLA